MPFIIDEQKMVNDNTFEYDDTRKCYDLLCEFLEYAKENGKTVKVNWW